MSLFNLITADERQKIEAAYAETAESLARYQRCKAVLDSNANLNDGKQRVRNWLQTLPEAEREQCRAVLNGIAAAKRHYAAVKASGQPTKPNVLAVQPTMPIPEEREALRQAVANRTGGR
ncbi:hypothetical protein V8687_18190 [Shewanella baltica]|uniref:hypothetical protein n=1 Tax=Shewanella baltica TaxID=62322 RepID=UPI0030D2D0C6